MKTTTLTLISHKTHSEALEAYKTFTANGYRVDWSTLQGSRTQSLVSNGSHVNALCDIIVWGTPPPNGFIADKPETFSPAKHPFCVRGHGRQYLGRFIEFNARGSALVAYTTGSGRTHRKICVKRGAGVYDHLTDARDL